MSTTTNTKLSELQAKAATLIRAGALVTQKTIAVIEDVGKSSKAIARALQNKGAVIVVQPVINGRVRDQSGTAWSMDFSLMVGIETNPEVNDSETGHKVNIYSLIVEVANSLCQGARHPGGEFFRLSKGDTAFEIVKFDEGLFSYALMFTKEGQL